MMVKSSDLFLASLFSLNIAAFGFVPTPIEGRRTNAPVFVAEKLRYNAAKKANELHMSDRDTDLDPSCITNNVLKQAYPALIEYKSEYGHPNIPLGSKEGRQCETLRRLHIQNKLNPEEIELLTKMEFRFHSLEDVYHEVDFDELYDRLVQLKQSGETVDIPKKYPQDPELGAWVTGIRRLSKDRVLPEHVAKLDDAGFIWVSSRKCGSKFMNMYRSIQQRLQEEDDDDVVWNDTEVIKFIRAQKEAYNRETLSETRVDYMTKLLGEEWWL